MATDRFGSANEGHRDRPLLGVAAQALSAVARTRKGPDRATEVEAALHTAFARAITNPAYGGEAALIAAMRARAVSSDTMLDLLIPRLAETIGEAWMTDDMPFAEVSLTAARLQRLAWHLFDLDRPTGARGRVLVVVPEGETHLLGAVLAISQLVRQGIEVTSRFGATEAMIDECLAARRFDGIAVSASAAPGLPCLRQLITRLQRADGRPPVALGGPILTFRREIAEQTGADMLTSDIGGFVGSLDVSIRADGDVWMPVFRTGD